MSKIRGIQLSRHLKRQGMGSGHIGWKGEGASIFERGAWVCQVVRSTWKRPSWEVGRGGGHVGKQEIYYIYIKVYIRHTKSVLSK